MIKVTDLHKRFKLADPKAGAASGSKDPRQRGRFFYSVEGASLSCRPGQVLGLIGPNGAGKTTTLRMISGVLKPDQGSISINDEDLHSNGERVRKKIGFLSASTSLYERFSVEENLRYFAGLYGLSNCDSNDQIDLLCQQLQMDSYRHRRVMDLSSGMKQRANIARAVVHQPQVIILDEPTTGLDIMSTEIVMEFIRQQQQQQVPVIFSTHHLEEVSLLCDQLCVIDKGHSAFNGSLEEYAGDRDAVSLRRRFMAEHQQLLAEAV
ncbi:ABC transporter ATP-binding protein [Ferrimonas lipolytica]|uniref:ATP-binding cassette domain-containing protein n=1 Tax=Ferrimonas lipolytica TaxID=2724191 RepID=A0A6H1UF48_9GAMM|nr:ATP-binding cassette domain-containing protein [Ferrimonas lipolytica]QIZ76836.1 ATP-binding cassette domain-containing protein [Ferrimonas lipolytica]